MRPQATERFIACVVQADRLWRRRRAIAPAGFRPWQRVWIEPIFNLLGLVLGQCVLLLPRAYVAGAQLWICEKMSGHAPETNPELPKVVTSVCQMARELYAATGRWPALLVGTTHPETLGADAWLRFELLRQGLVVANTVVTAAPHDHAKMPPQCFLAIDPFALDSVPVAVAATYAGFVHRQYLAWDRQSQTQSWLQRIFLLKGSGTDAIAWRLLRALKNRPVLMAFGGGLAHNARLLYGVREWAKSLPHAGPMKVTNQNVAALMTLVSEADPERLAAEDGNLPPSLRQSIVAQLREWGFSADVAASEVQRFVAEFLPAVPRRRRLLAILKRRLCDRGVPLILLPIVDAPVSPRVRFGMPVSLTAQSSLEAAVAQFHGALASASLLH